ncbi:hypothetical protein OH76DRAFT_1404561 [Lentinus brumalis]|uniref:DUF6533 domain-containing protein n=1 Tax=Lentinus brumalis TaxID=2498619 RepID=A0A371D7Y2_9APHY|nr:hypothetical protein OH76DRAFT_1404561 [Polyporus brumalis]
MSSDADAAAIVALSSALYTGWYCQLAASVLFIYDACVTFDREVTCFWITRWTGASLLFFAYKWISMAVYVMVLVQLATFPSDESCSMFQIALEAISIAQYVPGAIFSALRAYVLSRSKPLGFLVLALSLAPVGANLVIYGYQLTGENFPPFGCLESENTTEAIDIKVIAISRAPLILADILLIYITWTKLDSRSALRTDIRWTGRLSLSHILFRDGTIYFVVLSILNILHLVLSLTALQTGDNGGSYVAVFTAPLTAILISRFLIDLQEANQAVVRVDMDDPLRSSRDPYATPSFISSLGAFINPDVSASSDDELELHGVPCPGSDERWAPVSESQAASSSDL